MDCPKVKDGLRRLLPLMEAAAVLTPNKVDDAAVALLRLLADADAARLAAVAELLRK